MQTAQSNAALSEDVAKPKPALRVLHTQLSSPILLPKQTKTDQNSGEQYRRIIEHLLMALGRDIAEIESITGAHSLTPEAMIMDLTHKKIIPQDVSLELFMYSKKGEGRRDKGWVGTTTPIKRHDRFKSTDRMIGVAKDYRDREIDFKDQLKSQQKISPTICIDSSKGVGSDIHSVQSKELDMWQSGGDHPQTPRPLASILDKLDPSLSALLKSCASLLAPNFLEAIKEEFNFDKKRITAEQFVAMARRAAPEGRLVVECWVQEAVAKSKIC
jgi:hypothetical protein